MQVIIRSICLLAVRLMARATPAVACCCRIQMMHVMRERQTCVAKSKEEVTWQQVPINLMGTC